MDKLSKEQVLASSSGWVASLLNFLPGVGTGYLYQRRWLTYFITTGVVTAWFVIGIILQGDKEPSQTEQLIGCLLYTSPSPRDLSTSRMPSSA